MSKLLWVLVLFLSLTSTPAWAARGFGSTDGVGASDVIVTGMTSNSTTTSWCTGVWVTGDGGGGLGRIWTKNDSTTGEMRLIQNTGAGVWNLTQDWSTADGSWNITPPSSAAWHLVCVTYDGSSTSNDPIVYVDGSSVTVTEAQAPSGTRGTGAGAYYVGNRPDGTRNWNGRLSEFAVWDNYILSSGDASALWNSGSWARMDSLATQPTAYWTICGDASPEPNEIGGGSSGTVTGTVQRAHPFVNCNAPAASPPSQCGALMLLGIPC